MSRWPRFLLCLGAVAFFVVLIDAEPSAADAELMQALMMAGTRERTDFLR